MLFKIRTKLITAFLGIIFPFLFIVGVISIYNLSIIYKGIHKIEATTEQRGRVTDLRFAIEGALMPGNDYIITGDRKYIEEFQKESKVVEDRIKHVEEILAHPAGIYQASEKMEMLKDTKNAWRNIKGFSLRIFEIPDIIGNRDASRLMEEMDYKWGYPAIERLRQWREIDLEENREAHEMSEKAWRQASIIMVAGSIILVALGVSFALFYSKIFVKPIEAIHNGADAIASGNFKTRLDIKTGDEIQQLAGAMNEMAEKLDNFYGTLENQVRERTGELQGSEERFRIIAETAADGIICMRSPGAVTLWNRSAERMFGYTADEVIGKNLHDFIAPERYKERAREGLKGFFETGTGPVVGKTIEIFGLRRDGSEFPVELSISAMRIKDEWQTAAIVRDITERKVAEEARRQAEAELQRFFNLIPDMVCVASTDGHFLKINQAWHETLGYSEQEILSRPFLDFIHPDDRAATIREVERQLSGAATMQFFNRYICKDDSYRWLEWKATPAVDGRLLFASARDVTERKKAEMDIKEQLDELTRWQNATIGRELRMQEIKEENKILKKRIDEMEDEGMKG